MKLNLWMIANHLYQMEPEMNIPENAPVNLQSARLSSTPQCVYIYQRENDVICDAGQEGGSIIFHNENYKQILNAVQATFDFYQIWEETLLHAKEHMDYETIIQKSSLVFHNPMVLLDGSNKVLQMSSQYDKEDVNQDWAYLREHGHSSVRVIEYLMKEGRKNTYYLNRKAQIYHFNHPDISIPMISYALFWKEECLGRLNVLEYERKLNMGDIRLVEFVSRYLAEILGRLAEETDQTGMLTHYFSKMLLGQPVSETELEYWRQYVCWSSERDYRICVLSFGEELSVAQAIFVRNMIQNSIPQVLSVIHEGNIVFSVSDTQQQYLYRNKILENLRLHRNFQAGISLSYRQISEIPYMYGQAYQAAKYGLENPDMIIADFYVYAVRYMIEHKMEESFIYACHPDIRRLYGKDYADKEQMLETYFSYLKNHGSFSLTARELQIHKNTLRYRIGKMEETFQYDDDSSYTREYMLLSMYVLRLEKRKNEKADGEK